MVRLSDRVQNSLLISIGKRKIVVHEAPPREWQSCKEPLKYIDDQQLARLDPTGARAKLFDEANDDRAKPGDILHTTFTSGEPFSGIIMVIKGQGPHKSVLLRESHNETGCRNGYQGS